MLDEVALFVQNHMVDIMTKVVFSTNVTGLATVVTGLCDGFEGASVDDAHQNAKGKCT
jgi:hypothetical protein